MLGVLSDEQVERLLGSEVVGRIGCHAEGRTYVVPVTYVYDGSAIYGHTGDGMKMRMMRKNPDVAGRHPVVYRIIVREKTGRFEKR